MKGGQGRIQPKSWQSPVRARSASLEMVEAASAKREEFGGPGAEPPEKFLSATPLGLPENALFSKEVVHLFIYWS